MFLRFRSNTLVFLCCAALVLLTCRQAVAQGVTTSSMTGIVTDAQQQAVPGATVTAVHEPSGTTYTTVTNNEGRFFIPGMRVGGPYKVTATLSGFQTNVQEKPVEDTPMAAEQSAVRIAHCRV